MDFKIVKLIHGSAWRAKTDSISESLRRPLAENSFQSQVQLKIEPIVRVRMYLCVSVRVYESVRV